MLTKVPVLNSNRRASLGRDLADQSAQSNLSVLSIPPSSLIMLGVRKIFFAPGS
jgi:hypothetical protein